MNYFLQLEMDFQYLMEELLIIFRNVTNGTKIYTSILMAKGDMQCHKRRNCSHQSCAPFNHLTFFVLLPRKICFSFYYFHKLEQKIVDARRQENNARKYLCFLQTLSLCVSILTLLKGMYFNLHNQNEIISNDV